MKTFNRILKILIVLVGVVLTIVSFIPGSGFTKVWSYLATITLPFGVDLLRIFKVKVSREFECAYLLFVIPAMVLGIDFDVYKIIYPFDKIVHGLSGVLAVYGSREILDQASGKPDKTVFKVMFSICFVAFTAVMWECFEFLCDQLMHTNMQELIQCGTEDTMYDMVVAMVGGTVGTIIAYRKNG